MVTQRAADPTNRRRVVLLGASNLIRSISTVVETAQLLFDESLDLYTAAGHGRSYGQSTKLLGRQLPGILECEIWTALERPPHPHGTFALITDIGNDLMYHVPVATIASWVEECLVRLRRSNAAIVMTLLPLANLQKLSQLRFQLFRRLFFPSCEYELSHIATLATELDQCLRKLGKAYGARVVTPQDQWYGLDPIHIRLSQWRHAWPRILGFRNDSQAASIVQGSIRRWLYLRTRKPAERRLGRHVQCRQQPSGKLPDGSSVSFF